MVYIRIILGFIFVSLHAYVYMCKSCIVEMTKQGVYIYVYVSIYLSIHIPNEEF